MKDVTKLFSSFTRHQPIQSIQSLRELRGFFKNPPPPAFFSQLHPKSPIHDFKYKVSFTQCDAEERKKFSESHCLLPISVDSPLHEGAKFYETLQLIGRSFKQHTILVDDCIQRFTMSIDQKLNSRDERDKLAAQSIAAGDRWLERNNDAIQAMKTPPRILRWYHFYDLPEFEEALKSAEQLYEANPTFQAALDKNIVGFLKGRGLTPETNPDAVELSKLYLLEECGVMMHIWPMFGCEYEIYPSGRNPAMKAAYDLYIKPKYPNLLKSIGLRFVKTHKPEKNKEHEADPEPMTTFKR